MERFQAFSIGRLQFLDSFQFAPQSLDKLAATLKPEDFKHLRRQFPDNNQFNLLKQKGIFPYDFIDNISKLTTTVPTQFPTQQQFYNKLYDKGVSGRDYVHGKLVFETCCPSRTLREYHDIYLKTDVLLLADFFEKYRDTCLEHYGLDPVHYFSCPGMAFDAALKLSGK